MPPQRRTAAFAGAMLALATLPAARSFAPSSSALHLRPARISTAAVDYSRGSRHANLARGVVGAAMDVSSGDMAKSMREQREGALDSIREVHHPPSLPARQPLSSTHCFAACKAWG